MNRLRLILFTLVAVVSFAVPATTQAHAATATPDRFVASQAADAASAHRGDPSVSPRVSCGGFNGQVSFSSSQIQIWGQIWTTSCSNNTTLYISWNDAGGHHNLQVTAVNGFSNSVGVPVHTYGTSGTPSGGSVTACSTYGGWHCGTPYGW